MIYTIFIFILFLACYILSYLKKIKKLIFLFKILTSLSFMAIGIAGIFLNQKPTNTSFYLLAALFLGVNGDIILGIRSFKYPEKITLFIFGLMFFSLGHILYIFASLSIYHQYSFYELLDIGLVVLVVILIIGRIKFNFKKAALINYTYIAISSSLLVMSLLSLINVPNNFTKLFFSGILLFVSSDFLLAFIYFMTLKVKTKDMIKILNILTYFIGQALIAYSIIFL